MPDYSEDEMAKAFEGALRRGVRIPGLGRVWKVFREVDCQRGRPDFVCIGSGPTRKTAEPVQLGLAGASVMALLHDSVSRDVGYLRERSAFGESAIRRALRQLTKAGHLVETRKGRFRRASALPGVELWAFELKLSKAKRAVFQAQQYRAFASRVFIVVPLNAAYRYEKYSRVLARWGIGIVEFDPSGCMKLVVPAGDSKPLSAEQHLYAVAKVLGRRDAAVRRPPPSAFARRKTVRGEGPAGISALRTGRRRHSVRK